MSVRALISLSLYGVCFVCCESILFAKDPIGERYLTDDLMKKNQKVYVPSYSDSAKSDNLKWCEGNMHFLAEQTVSVSLRAI